MVDEAPMELELVSAELAPSARELPLSSPIADTLRLCGINVAKELCDTYKSLDELGKEAERCIQAALGYEDENEETKLSLAGGVFRLDIIKTKGRVLNDIGKLMAVEEENNLKRQLINVTKINPPPPPPPPPPKDDEYQLYIPSYKETVVDGKRIIVPDDTVEYKKHSI